MSFLHVKEASFVAGYRIWVVFSDGVAGEVDLADSLAGEIFEPLNEPAVFSQFKLEGGTIAWANGADLAPEYLRELMSLTRR